MELTCPVCKKTLIPQGLKNPKETKFFPFCSERCKLIDLGSWLDSRYKIISELPSQPANSSESR